MNEQQCPHQHGTKLRPELPPLTARIAKLKVDDRSYPIPFFVAYVDGKADFRVIDPQKYVACVKQKLCWVCGEPLNGERSFVIGPMCAVNRISAEPPSHQECAEWSAKGCPFLTRPNMVRREDEITKAGEANVAGTMIKRNPGCMLIWNSAGWRMVQDGKGGVLFDVGNPVSISFWREGRPATEAEVNESIATGIPFLKQACEQEHPSQKAEAMLELGIAVGHAMDLIGKSFAKQKLT